MSVKTSVNIPDDIFREAKKLSDNFRSSWFFVLCSTLVVLSIASPSFGKEPDKSFRSVASKANPSDNISFAIGKKVWLSKGDSHWNIANIGGSPNILSELEYKHIDSTVIEFYGELGIHSEHFLMLEYGYGSIRNGRFIDSDYAGDNRTGLFFRSSGSVEDDNLWYLNIDYALRVFRVPAKEKGQDSFLDLLFGYQHWKEDIIMTNGYWDVYKGVPYLEPIPGLKSSYVFELDSIKVEARVKIPVSGRLSLKASLFVIPWTYYRGEGIWNLRTDFRQDPSFKHRADGGFGGGVNITLSHNPWRDLFIEAGYRYWEIESGDGTDTIYFSDGRIVTIPFNEANIQRRGIILGIRYVF